MMLSVKNVGYRYGRDFNLEPTSLDFTEPVTALIGPNGAGKSTLLKCLAMALPGSGYQTFQEAGSTRSVDREFLHRSVSYLPQAVSQEASLTVFETVLLGLLDTLGFKINRTQAAAVEQILVRLELTHLASRSLRELSGGQRQMVLLAQALIKKPKILLLDEPLNNLDVHRQFVLMNLLRELAGRDKMLTIVVLHDIPLAARYANRIAVMHNGRLHAYGPPAEVLTSRLMRQVYRLETAVHQGTAGCPLLEYLDVVHESTIPKKTKGKLLYEYEIVQS